MCLNDEGSGYPLQVICCWSPVLSQSTLEEINPGACLSSSRRKGARDDHPLSWSLSDDENEAINLIPLTESWKGVFWVNLSFCLHRGRKEESQDSRLYYPEDSTYESIQMRGSRISQDRTHSCRNQNKERKEHKKKEKRMKICTE